MTSGPTTAANEAPAARRFSWAALAAAALGTYEVVTMTSSPSSSPAGGMPLRLATDSSTTRPPKREPAWFTSPDTVPAASRQSRARLAARRPSPAGVARTAGSRRDRIQRATAVFVRVATPRWPAATCPRQRASACWYSLSWNELAPWPGAAGRPGTATVAGAGESAAARGRARPPFPRTRRSSRGRAVAVMTWRIRGSVLAGPVRTTSIAGVALAVNDTGADGAGRPAVAVSIGLHPAVAATMAAAPVAAQLDQATRRITVDSLRRGAPGSQVS